MQVDAEITIKFIVPDICDSEELDDCTSFEDLVKDAIDENGLFDLLVEDGDYEITEIKQIH
jgi:hypothetical protein